MALTINNNNQLNLLNVIVNPLPDPKDSDLVFTRGGSSTIFPNLTPDQVNTGFWYHGGNPKVDPAQLSFAGCNIVTTTNTELDTVSGAKTKGVTVLNVANIKNILTITNPNSNPIPVASPVEIQTSVPHFLTTGDLVLITGVTGSDDVIDGIFTINVTAADTFELIGVIAALDATYSGGTIQSYKYNWDEVYTTPLGLHEAVDQAVTLAGLSQFQFFFTTNDSNTLNLRIDDPNVVPKIGDSITIQRFFDNVNSFTNSSPENGTDGINNTPIYTKTESYTFKITSVVAALTNLTPPYVVYSITLDKSFKPIVSSPTTKYMVVLLNRIGTGLNKELFTDTWQLKEVHREQLLGDPYNFTGVTQPKGRKNYLYYESGQYLGVRNILNGILEDKKTPFVILDFGDEIKDRIWYDPNEVEVHLPAIMIQGQNTPLVLTNSQVFSTDPLGENKYAGLFEKFNSDGIRYGWVMFDLRIIVIDHPELVTALSYNANRNYTLATPTLPKPGNNLQNPTPINPLTIVSAINSVGVSGTPIRITTTLNHNFTNGDAVVISGVLGNLSANSPAASVYYAKTNNVGATVKDFDLYVDSLLTVPVTSSGAYVPGTGIVYGTRLAYEYFITYRLNGVHYDTAPYAEVSNFNFQLNNSIDRSAAGDVQLDFDFLTHLIDVNNLEGFDANTFEIIIGKYVADLSDPYKIGSVTNIMVMTLGPGNALKNLGNVQFPSHTITYTKNDYDTLVSSFTPPTYDLINNFPIYNIFPIPDTLFTGEGAWTLGMITHREHAKQYRLQLKFIIPADKWNGTTNPSFIVGDQFMKNKIISEIAFRVGDDEGPYIYAKVSPPISKNNSEDLTISATLDF